MTTFIIDKLSLHRVRIPLKTPYKVAFALIEHFDTIVVELVDRDGNVGLGEATILTGYTDETIDESWAAAKAFANSLMTLSQEGALREIDGFGIKFPFAATAFGTAFEMASGSAWLQTPAEVSVPLIGLLNAKFEGAIEEELQALIDAGYGTVKVKVGFDAEKDAQLVKLAQRGTKGRMRIRLDANQGYTAEQALQFVKTLDPVDIELFEQPCQAGDWDSHLAVRRVSPVPMMLDESIYTLADIEKAARLDAASYIKVKLMKFVTLDALSSALERIKALGMLPVLGNGVACDLGCWMELCIAARYIDNAGEMNGFLKASTPLLADTLQLQQDGVRLQADFSPKLNRASLAKHLVESVVYRPGVAPKPQAGVI